MCGQHQLTDSNGEITRVACPFTKTHNVAVADFNHASVCAFNPQNTPKHKCYRVNVNRGSPLSEPNSATNQSPGKGSQLLDAEMNTKPLDSVNQLSELEFTKFYSMFLKLYTSVQPRTDFKTSILTHPALHDRMVESSHGKHPTQQSSLIGHLHRLNLLSNPNTTFIEFGCGSGQLSRYIFDAHEAENCSFLLVDRKRIKSKSGHSIKQAKLQKILIDIKDLELDLVLENKCVAVSKHLCGAATDLTLRCLFNYMEKNNDGVHGVCIALCCHQVCDFRDYINHPYLISTGIGALEFDYLKVMSTWSLCASTEEKKNHWTGLSVNERINFGEKCKRFLDIGRLQAMHQQGFDAELVYFVDKQTSLENMCLVASMKPK